MKIPTKSTDAFNIVVLGSWNPAIFSPEWSRDHLSIDKDKEAVWAVAIQNGITPRLTVEDVNFYPTPISLMLDCVEFSDESQTSCVNKLLNIAELLPHTPVNAMGINFRYIAKADESLKLSSIFTFADASLIDSEKFSLVGSELKRSFRHGDSTVMNLKLEMIFNEINIEFNYHTNLNSIQDIKKYLTEERVQQLQSISKEFLSTVYDCEVEDNENE